ncbi:MAG: flagellar basal body-associated FliL family protein [Gammaproteobacteria bacterium]|nr:flagellar basal body-associated FliL family protein [Gammaproteobacteria bacterium]MBQ0839545.1 flagellar basal body-associated FliL family protein [Gammaproteobacteria bacterium]
MNKTVAIIVTIVALLVAGGGGAWFYFSDGSAAADTTSSSSAIEARGESYYLALEPPFIVNFVYKDTLRYLQMTLSVMSHEPKILEQVTHHMPAIRHRLIMLISNKSFDELNGEDSKEALREEMLLEIRNIIQAEQNKTHNPGRVEAVYFTGYVMQ